MNVKCDFKVVTLTRQQSHADRGTTHLRFRYSSLKEKNEKTNVVKGQRQYEMLTAFGFIAPDSLESAAKRVVLMNNMSDGSSAPV